MLGTTENIKDGGFGRMNTTRQRGEEEEPVDEEGPYKSFTVFALKGERSRTDGSILFLRGQTKHQHFLGST